VENQVYVALAGNVGNLPDVENMDVQYGQAAIFTPCDFAFARDGIAAEAESNEETVLICDLDLDDLHHHHGNARHVAVEVAEVRPHPRSQTF
jgi:predicted amidohydrolase